MTPTPENASANLPGGETLAAARGGLEARRLRLIALGAGTAAVLLMFFIAPYQHWFYEHRESVMRGWSKTIVESHNGEWMFCFAVPILAGFLVWLRRERLKALPLDGSWLGLAVLAVSLLAYWIGYKVDTGYAGFISAQIAVAGLVLLLGGRQWMKALLFPWAFLVFMWPMFPIEERIIGHLRLLTASLSDGLLGLMGVDVVREGTQLASAGNPAAGVQQGASFQLDVEEPCSGVRSLYSLVMVSALYGHLSLKRTVPRLILFLSAIPLAMLGNVVRMVLLALGSLWFGSEFAVGRNIDGQQEMSLYHTLCGYAVFAVALAGMFALCSLLEGKHWKSLKKLGKSSAAKISAASATAAPGSRILAQSAAAVAAALAAIGICFATDTNPHLAQPGVVMELPLQFDQYSGTPHDMTAIERDILDEGVSLARNIYLSPEQRQILATVIESGPTKRTLHRPEVCLPGQGWNITDRLQTSITTSDGRSFDVAVLRMFRDMQSPDNPGSRQRVRALSIYWYVGSDGVTSPEYYDHLWISYRDALLRNMSHRWAMANLFVTLPEEALGFADPLAEATALEELKTFAGKLAPHFMKKAGGE